LGQVSFEYGFNNNVNKINPETKKIVGPVDGLVKVTETNLGPPDPGFTPEEWKTLKSAQYAGVISAGKDTACPIWIDYVVASLKHALSADVDGLWVDNYSPWDNFNAHPNLKSFGEWSVAGFRPFFQECTVSGMLNPESLKELGINDVSTFDVREYLQKKCSEWGGEPTNLSDAHWRDARWQNDPIWRAFLVYKRRQGTEAFERYYSTIKKVAAEAGKPDFLVTGNDIPMFSLGWIRGELDMVSTELSWGWHLTSGPRGLMPPPRGSYVPIAKLGREHAKSRFVNAWYYVPKEQKDKPNIARVVNYQGLANHLLPAPQYSSRTIGTPEVNAAFFEFIRQIRPILRNRIPYDEQIGLYYSSSSQLMEMLPGGFRAHNAQPHSFAFYGWGTVLSQLHYGWRAIPQWKLTEENLASLKVLVLPNVSVFDRAQLPLLKNWVEQGGTLVISGDFAKRHDEDRLFEPATPLSEPLLPEDNDAALLEKRVKKGKIILLKKDFGYEFYLLGQERVAMLEALKPQLNNIVAGHVLKLGVKNVPSEIGITLYQDDTKLFVDLNNTNIDTATDTITQTPTISFEVELPEHLRGKEPKLRVLSPENPPTVSVKKIGTDRIQIDVSTFDVYTCLVFE
jgi:hypothetical protein